jgi:hypothetical protein
MRGVQVRTSARVTRIERGEGTSGAGGKGSGRPLHLLVGDDAYPAAKRLESKQVFLCVPLARTLSLLPREALGPGQSKLLSRHRPRSLVAVEYPDVAGKLQPIFPSECRSGDLLSFPVERARGCLTSQGGLVLTGWLDFEDSLQAPSVRELLGRLRKAAARVLKPEALRLFQGQGAGIASLRGPRERVVLLPVGLATPQEALPRETCLESKTSWSGLYVCGDGFTASPLPWKNVIHSVHEGCTLASKE